MTLWLIEPRDPIIFRDGRPFSAQPGARAKTLPFPYPSTIIGAIRSHAGRNAAGHFDTTRIPELLQKGMRGPLLVSLDDDGNVADWHFPAPADALLLKREEASDDDTARLVPLTPLARPEGAATNLDGLLLVGPASPVKDKPYPRSPAFWNWKAFEQWLVRPEAQEAVALTALGLSGLAEDSRMHVRIDPGSQTAEAGALFQTTGLSFTYVTEKEHDTPLLTSARRLALAVDTDAEMKPDWGFLGGERRMARWQKPSQAQWSTCPPEVRQRIKADGHARIILLTPALFEQGFLPTWLPASVEGVQVTIEAAAVNRYQTVSGWDYENNRPKPTRRLAPAGSVYFIQLDGDEAAIDRFIDAVWMHNISDDEQDRRDGFGLAVLGVWDGVPQEVS
jgi:CRISPR-associated protein Cmr3